MNMDSINGITHDMRCFLFMSYDADYGGRESEVMGFCSGIVLNFLSRVFVMSSKPTALEDELA